jgi:hypothetical protein
VNVYEYNYIYVVYIVCVITVPLVPGHEVMQDRPSSAEENLAACPVQVGVYGPIGVFIHIVVYREGVKYIFL